MGDQTILRTVIPFRNREACHRCHEPSHRINGIMLFDLDAGGIRDEVNSDLRWLVGGTAAFALVLIVLIAIVVRVFVLRRLQRFETTARLIAGETSRSGSPRRAPTPFPGWPGSSTPWPTR